MHTYILYISKIELGKNIKVKKLPQLNSLKKNLWNMSRRALIYKVC
jgi:hypothetical protein